MGFFIALGLGLIILACATLFDIDTVLKIRTRFQHSLGDGSDDPMRAKRFLRFWACAMILLGVLLSSLPLLQRMSFPSSLTSLNVGHLILSLFGAISGLSVLGLCAPRLGRSVWGPAWPGHLHNTHARRLKYLQNSLLALTFLWVGLLFSLPFYDVTPPVTIFVRILALLLCLLLLLLGRRVRTREVRSQNAPHDAE